MYWSLKTCKYTVKYFEDITDWWLFSGTIIQRKWTILDVKQIICNSSFLAVDFKRKTSADNPWDILMYLYNMTVSIYNGHAIPASIHFFLVEHSHYTKFSMYSHLQKHSFHAACTSAHLWLSFATHPPPSIG